MQREITSCTPVGANDSNDSQLFSHFVDGCVITSFIVNTVIHYFVINQRC